MANVVSQLGVEVKNFKHKVHLLTISRLLPGTLECSDLRDIQTMTREEVAGCVRMAFDDPMYPPHAPGQRRSKTESIVKNLVVFQEAHSDGSKHFHIAVQLTQTRTWNPVKYTLRTRDHLACHFSSSHTQFWSAVRYGHIPTCSKPVVDESPLSWSASGGWGSLDLFAESQRPWNADIWKRRREEAEKASEASKAKKPRFNKLDLTALILTKGLTTQAALMEYVQNHGTEQMQIFVHQKQKYLKEYLADAAEWGLAREKAAAERKSEWETLCGAADDVCPHGCTCTYASAASAFFEANAATVKRVELAVALRSILLMGPSKTTRVPMITGPTNSGKSTLVLPLDDLFGFAQVFHKPALGSSFALRNILKEKTFLFWDDYRPVEYGQKTVPVTTFLSLFHGQPFEVQVSQSFNDGNIDFEWHRGCLLTAKAKDLWAPLPGVDEEDIKHMKSRLMIFPCTETIPALRPTTPCKVCFSKWVRDGALEYDAAQALHVPRLALSDGSQQDIAVVGMNDVLTRAKLPTAKATELTNEVVSLGALDIAELSSADWQGLASFQKLLPFEQRRLLAVCASSCNM
eukprot:Skav200447  [mRNA]  locus=scaffold1922:147746:149470:+ [translate_table: standard]